MVARLDRCAWDGLIGISGMGGKSGQSGKSGMSEMVGGTVLRAVLTLLEHWFPWP